MSAEEIQRLVAEWHDDTAVHSSSTIILAHPNVGRLIDLGMDAVPHLIGIMRERPTANLPYILHKITGEQPIPPEDAGRVAKMNEHWIKLAEEKGWV